MTTRSVPFGARKPAHCADRERQGRSDSRVRGYCNKLKKGNAAEASRTRTGGAKIAMSL
jgi:hypothetical protein